MKEEETPPQPSANDPFAALKTPEFRFMIGSSACSTLASRSLAVALGLQVYRLTKDPLALGMVGLVQAIPVVSILLFGGLVADRNDRRRIVLTTQSVSVLCALVFALLALNPQSLSVWMLYAVVFVSSFSRGFESPAYTALEAQVVPRQHFVNASAWLSSTWLTFAIVGPALGGFACHYIGISGAYFMAAALYACAFLSISRIKPKPIPPVDKGESIWTSIAQGVQFVKRSQILVGAMALDLFAVLFGGAVALLPVFAEDILKVDARGLGYLESAPAVGALLVTIWSVRRPPARNAGRILLFAVAGFGFSMILFGFSTNFYLSMFALALSGAFDGISMVIRRSIVRLLSPENMRGRIASVNMIFISSSNEIGAFESGVAARFLGTGRAVWLGGMLTLLVVGITASLAPKLRTLDLYQKQKEQEPVSESS